MIVFLGFAAGELLTIKEVGLGMAIAVVLDATVVRMLLVPATMKLMGRAGTGGPRRPCAARPPGWPSRRRRLRGGRTRRW